MRKCMYEYYQILLIKMIINIIKCQKKKNNPTTYKYLCTRNTQSKHRNQPNPQVIEIVQCY